MVEGIFHATSLTMEIPTGVIADLFGRKFSRLLGILLYILYLLLMLFGNNLLMISIAFILCGLSYTLESGAGDALVYDSLIEIGEAKNYSKVNSIKEVFYQLGTMLSLLIGGYIATQNYDLVFKLAILIAFITFIIIYKMRETKVDRVIVSTSFKKKFKAQYIDSIRYIFSNKRLRFLIVISSLFTFPVTLVFFYSQNHFTELGYSPFDVGFFLSLHSAFAIIGALLVSKILKTFNERMILLLLPIVEIILLWLMITDYSYIPFIILGAVESIFYVIMLDYINKIIPSNKRATILSMSGMIFSILMILIFPLVGLISDHYSFTYGFIFNASIITIGYIIYILNYRKLNA
ncbi:MFS transporter [Mycoplasmatota bacterium]|nr:MFS transporter [Mycoplasmatota bacterium]